jgi:hypothetical protein
MRRVTDEFPVDLDANERGDVLLVTGAPRDRRRRWRHTVWVRRPGSER